MPWRLMGDKCRTPPLLKVRTIWRWTNNFLPLPIYPRKLPRRPLSMRFGNLQSPCRHFGKDKNCLPLHQLSKPGPPVPYYVTPTPTLNLRFIQRTTRVKLNTEMLPEFTLLSIPSSIYIFVSYSRSQVFEIFHIWKDIRASAVGVLAFTTKVLVTAQQPTHMNLLCMRF